jgi:hypothetical protein
VPSPSTTSPHPPSLVPPSADSLYQPCHPHPHCSLLSTHSASHTTVRSCLVHMHTRTPSTAAATARCRQDACLEFPAYSARFFFRFVLCSFVLGHSCISTKTFQIFTCDESHGCSPALTHALRLDVLDNHGHANYTCIYNIKVFGNVAGGDDSIQEKHSDAASMPEASAIQRPPSTHSPASLDFIR